MDLLKEVASLYQQLPQVACRECGQCCVSPTCTLAEFIYLMHHCAVNLPQQDLEEFIFSVPLLSEAHEGNIVCAFLKNKLCSVHLWRTGACRLFGIPALEKLGVSDLVSCFNSISVVSGASDEAFIRAWLDRITSLNTALYPFGKAPYHVYGFNLECWLDIYFDDLFTVDVFADIRAIMARYFDLSKWKQDYKARTGLKEKIDKISILSLLLETGDRDSIKELLVSIWDGYPLTGTYFQKEAQEMLDMINK
jgi:hypothetical protein